MELSVLDGNGNFNNNGNSNKEAELQQLLLLSTQQVQGLSTNAMIINQILNKFQQDFETVKTSVSKIESNQVQIMHRLSNLDLIDIEGTPRERLTKMVKKYAFKHGKLIGSAWGDFKECFNTAYGINLKSRKTHYMEENKIKKMSYPEYLEKHEMLDDAIRVADKMLNQSGFEESN